MLKKKVNCVSLWLRKNDCWCKCWTIILVCKNILNTISSYFQLLLIGKSALNFIPTNWKPALLDYWFGWILWRGFCSPWKFHFTCLLWSSKTFSIAELVSEFRLLRMYQTFKIFNPNDGLVHLHRRLFGAVIEGSTEQLPNAGLKSTPGLNLQKLGKRPQLAM